MADKVPIPAEVLKGIEAIRRSGRTNMLDRVAVAAIALELGFVEAAFWIEDKANRKAYAEGIFRGFTESTTTPETPSP